MTSTIPSSGAFARELYCPMCEDQFAGTEVCPNDGTRLVRLGSGTDRLVGRELDGRFTIIEKLGAGGMGIVYRARQHSVDREIAIKVLNGALVTDPASTRRFLREAKLISRLAHPSIVAVLDFGQTTDDLFYLALELVTGRTLQHVLQAEGMLPTARAARIATQICDALEAAHQLAIVHRDLKPANVMVLDGGRDLIKVLDFGLAKSVAAETSTTITNGGGVLGTPMFMPPELANGEPCDGRADLYSLGCMLHLMVCGRAPFVTDSIPEMIAMHGTQAAPPTRGVPRPFAAVIDRLLRKDPTARYQTAGEVREALERALEPAARAAVATKLAPAPKPSRWIVPALATAALALALALVRLQGTAPAPPIAGAPAPPPTATPPVTGAVARPAPTTSPVAGTGAQPAPTTHDSVPPTVPHRSAPHGHHAAAPHPRAQPRVHPAPAAQPVAPAPPPAAPEVAAPAPSPAVPQPVAPALPPPPAKHDPRSPF